jgi:hypothetical protein
MSIQRLTTWGGDTDIRSSEDEITDGNFYGFTVNEDDTVVSIMSGGPDGNIPSPAIDYRGEEFANITSKTLFAGQLITIEQGHIIKNFKCSAGSVTLHKEKSK